jgi:hypothetical protein
VGGVAGVLAAGRGRPDVAAGPLGELDAELALQRRDGRGDARLRDVQLLGGLGDRAEADDGEEGG